tara:strand:+ start:283 stop:1011 length:729 start_codon:yes stop_codon:yes gene_type:complete
MLTNYRFKILPPVVKNLLIINVLLFITTGVIQSAPFNINLTQILGLHYWQSDFFKPWQIVTYMFMHGNLSHIIVNMIPVYFLGVHLENRWGSKRFLKYYLLTGFGAAFLHYLIVHFQILNLVSGMDYNQISLIVKDGIVPEGISKIDAQNLFKLYHVPVVGASGSLFGILFAFGALFPNVLLYLYFAIPIKAKYLVIGYGLMELFLGISNNPQDNIAHFAHLGGMLFGLIIFAYWRLRDKYY